VLFGFLVFQFFSRQQRLAPGELTPAVFAAQDIEIGTLLTSELLDVRDVSVRAVPDSHLSFKEGAVGKLTRYPLVKGEVILPEYGLQNTDCFRETVDIGIGLEYTTNTL